MHQVKETLQIKKVSKPNKVEERTQIKQIKSAHKQLLREHYGKDYKKHLNIPELTIGKPISV